jgi:hypothetical protein
VIAQSDAGILSAAGAVPARNPPASSAGAPSAAYRSGSTARAPSPGSPAHGPWVEDAPSSPPATTPAAPPPLWVERYREELGWLLAVGITFGVAIWIYVIQLAYPIPPGSDPGNWISISYAYIGGHYAGQVNPYGYPPLLFPILGALVLLTGSPLAAGHLIVPILIVGLGLTTYALSRVVLRSVILSLAVLSVLLLDPYFMTMFFWGALPNLLAFVFTNLALLGLVWVGTGRLLRGVVFFWTFGAAAVLSHSLGGLALGATVAVALTLSMFVPVRRSTGPSRLGDRPGLLLRRLVFSFPGYVGAIGFALAVGGWYVATAALRVTHPSYFTPGTAVHPATYGQFLRNLLPGLTLGGLVVFYLLIILVVVVLAVFGGLLSFRPQWITTPLLVLLGAWIAIPGLAIIGWLLSISTDYHRFGFLLVIPAGLSIAYLIDRLWLGRPFQAKPPSAAESANLPPPADPTMRPFPPTLHATPRARTAFVGIFAVVIVVLAGFSAGPIYVRYENLNSGTTHDQLFLDALAAIDHSGLPGSVLTVKGNLKWTWAITQRNAYAPRPGNAFLFYPVQITDSTLAYYALTSSDAVTNGLVSVSLRGTTPAFVDGIPDIAVFQAGGLSATMQIPPQYVTVTLVGATNDTAYTVGLSGSPTFQGPSGPGLPAVITYTEPQFILRQTITIPTGSPTVYVSASVQATGPDRVLSLQEVITPPPLLEAYTAYTDIPGTFTWQPYISRYLGLITQATITPASALTAVTAYNGPGGGAAATIDFTAPADSPVTSLSGVINLTTPAALSSIPNLPPYVNTTQVWQQLGVEFILLPNLQSFSLYSGSYLVNEAEYLVGEFGCRLYYGNSEWLVLTVPST